MRAFCLSPSHIHAWNAPTDSPSPNALHLAAHGGHAFAVTYLITVADMDVNCPDTMQRTPLMWSAYLGNSGETVQELLRSGASLTDVDSSRFSALSWAVVSGHLDVARELVRAGAPLDITDKDGKTLMDWATEKKCEVPYTDILREFNKLPSKLGWLRSLDKGVVHNILFAVPCVLIPFALLLLLTFPWYTALGIFAVTFYVIVDLALLRNIVPPSMDLMSTPFMSAIPLTTMALVLGAWVRTVPSTVYHYPFHMAFVACFSACAYNYWAAMKSDPGTIPKRSMHAARVVVVGLVERGDFTPRHYCCSCRVGKPVRSKHCRYCDRCVERFDHHW